MFNTSQEILIVGTNNQLYRGHIDSCHMIPSTNTKKTNLYMKTNVNKASDIQRVNFDQLDKTEKSIVDEHLFEYLDFNSLAQCHLINIEWFFDTMNPLSIAQIKLSQLLHIYYKNKFFIPIIRLPFLIINIPTALCASSKFVKSMRNVFSKSMLTFGIDVCIHGNDFLVNLFNQILSKDS